jgi:hypothetical protein
MIEEQKPAQSALRPFFITAIEQGDGLGRRCDVNSENVTFIRPVYTNNKPNATETMLLTNTGKSRTSHLIVEAPYPVVRDIFARHGYEFIDASQLQDEVAAFAARKSPSPT